MTVVVAVFAEVILILTSPVSSVAATRTWTGGGAPIDAWSNPANWASNVVPVDGDDLVFPAGTGPTTMNDLPNLLVNSLSISSSTTFSGRRDPAAERHHGDGSWRRDDRRTADRSAGGDPCRSS
jgi:hypothetical protein